MKPHKAAKLGLGGSGSRRDVFARVRKGTVAICRVAAYAPGAEVDLHTITILGTGVVVDNRGLVLTAKHVVEPMMKELQALNASQLATADTLRIVTEKPPIASGDDFNMSWNVGSVTRAKVSAHLDLAVLEFRVDEPIAGSFKALALSDEPCRQGDEVGFCGYPFGQQLHAEIYNNLRLVIPSFSAGIVSVVLPHPDAPLSVQTVFQMDAMVNSGNSGGPVFKIGTGEVVGIAVESVNLLARVLIDDSAPATEEKRGPSGPASGHFEQMRVPTGLARAVHVHQAKALINEMASTLQPVAPGLSRRSLSL